MNDTTARGASYSLWSILAIVGAIGSFFVSAPMQFMLALAAIVLGAIGVLMALTPGKRGGMISLASIGIGVVAIVVAVIRGILWIIF